MAGVTAELRIRHPFQCRVLNTKGKAREVQFSHPRKEKIKVVEEFLHAFPVTQHFQLQLDAMSG